MVFHQCPSLRCPFPGCCSNEKYAAAAARAVYLGYLAEQVPLTIRRRAFASKISDSLSRKTPRLTGWKRRKIFYQKEDATPLTVTLLFSVINHRFFHLPPVKEALIFRSEKISRTHGFASLVGTSSCELQVCKSSYPVPPN